MQFTATEDIEAPLDAVFAALSDFETIERQALRRGIDVQRTSEPGPAEAGMTWQAAFAFRGKQRSADIQLVTYTPPERMAFETKTGGLVVNTGLEVVALSRQRTRVSMQADLLPKTLSARLLVQSLKLAKGGVDKRFRKRIRQLAEDLEARLQRSA